MDRIFRRVLTRFASGHRWTLALLFVSGACALGYQVLWVRQFSLVIGADAGTVGVVVGAFMGGMALGYLFAGARLPRSKRRLLAFGLLEGGIGLCALALGFAMPWVYHLSDLFFAQRFGPFADLAWRVGVTGACLLPPTFLMGASFPAFFAGDDALDPGSPRHLSTAYALNLAGASFGALLLGFVLLEAMGVAGCTVVLGVTNLLLGGVAIVVSRKAPLITSAPMATSQTRPELLPLVIGFASGFLSLWFEVVWIRAIVPFSGSTVYALSVVLAIYLLGLGLGSRLVPWAARFGKPWTAGLILGFMGLGIGGADLLTHLWFRIDPDVSRLVARLELPIEPFWVDYPHVGVIAAIRLAWLTTWPVAVMSGMLLPLLIRKTGDLGAGVGRLYGINAIGCLAGSLLAQFVGLPLLGVRGSMVSASVLAFGAATLWVLKTGFGLRRLSLLGLAFAAVLLPPRRSIMRLFAEEIVQSEMLFYREDALGSVMVIGSERWSEEPGRLLVNGHGIAGATGAPQLATVPVSCVPNARRAAVIGLGAGVTCQKVAMLGAETDCIEILPSVIRAQPIFRKLRKETSPDNTPPGVRYFLDDGRRFLHASSEQYDIIVVDGTQPVFEGGTALLTDEFFKIVASRLRPGGIFTLWVGLALTCEPIMERTLLATFPWVAELQASGMMLAHSGPPEALQGLCTELTWWSPSDIGGVISRGPLLTDDDPSVMFELLRRREWAAAERIGRVTPNPRPRAGSGPSGSEPAEPCKGPEPPPGGMGP